MDMTGTLQLEAAKKLAKEIQLPPIVTDLVYFNTLKASC